MKKKVVIYSILSLFTIFTIYKSLLIFVLNITSFNSNYIEHSNSVEISKKRGLYAGAYTLKQKFGSSISYEYLPMNLFIERERIVYPNYYFYFGKTEIGNRLTINGNIFSELAKTNEYHIICQSSTQPQELLNTGQSNLSFFFKKKENIIYFTISRDVTTLAADTLIYVLNN